MIFILKIRNKFHNIHNNVFKKNLKDKNIFHYLIKYDTLYYPYNKVYDSFNISYFSRDNDLLNKFSDLDELRNYEYLENDKSILIKKFKIRVSIIETMEFSNCIIASDDYMFDLANLYHSNSFIKIAIIKDNLDDWLNSENLNYYDFIFTDNVEYKKVLREHYSPVFSVNGNSIYLQLKNILNSLRKREKFHYLFNNQFTYVFPKFKNYFKIYHSEYFDEQWYKEKYGILDNTDSVIHFILIGHSKYFNPGPNFDSWEYHELNKDVKKVHLNPLLHYELYGKNENRRYQFSKEEKEDLLSTILNSPFFDSQWYEDTYDISKDFLDPVNHYLKLGNKKGYNPGPNFSTNEYYECNPDVKEHDMNALLHYEKYGRNEGRKLSLRD